MRHELGLGQFLGALAVDHKPRVLHRFLVTGDSRLAALGRQVVLKVYGDRPRGEGPLQQLWRANGLDAPRLEFGETGGCSWLAMEYLDLRPITNTCIDQMRLVDRLARISRVMHRPARDLDWALRPLNEVILPRWEGAARALRRCGYRIPSSWQDMAVAAYLSNSVVPLHGDLAPANMGFSRDGRLIVFDASAFQGTPYFDAARWSARVGPGGAGPEALLKRWIAVEGLVMARKARDLLAAECVMEAGSRLIAHDRASRDGFCLPDGAQAGALHELLALASRQWP